MNLWLRLLWLLATAWRRPPLALPFGVSRLGFRVWPHDLDTSLHMNNGRYWTLMDLGRTDLMLGSGLWRSVLRQRWTPVVSAGQIRFRRELRPFQAFDLETRLAHWDEARFVIEHRLVIRETGAVAAIGSGPGGSLRPPAAQLRAGADHARGDRCRGRGAADARGGRGLPRRGACATRHDRRGRRPDQVT
jgi:acyl-CoA thioesterase FadM